LQKKGIWTVSTFLNLDKNIASFYLNVFFSTKQSRFYKSKRIKRKALKNKALIKSIASLSFPKLHKLLVLLFKKSNIYFNIINLNQNLNQNFLKDLYEKTKKYKSMLFQRRVNLYFDTIKLITLYASNLIHTTYFLLNLSNIFKYLSKKLHGKFVTFLETIIYALVYNPYLEDRRAKNSLGYLKGIKFRINGKLKGKMRASTHLITYGQIPNQSIGINIEYAMIHTFTRYGAFGMHAWVYK